MRVTVIGSRGLLGQRLVSQLQGQQHTVHAVSSRTSGGIDPESGRLSAAFAYPAGTEAVVYLAQSPHYRRLPEMIAHVWNVNVISAVEAADAARRAGVSRFIYASTGSVYGPSFTSLGESASVRRDRYYPLSKLQAEEALAPLRNDLRLTMLRPFGLYGPGQTGMLVSNLADSVAKRQPITIDRNPCDPGDEAGLKISLCYVDDAAAMVARLLTVAEPPPVLNIAGALPVSIREIAETIGALLEREVLFSEVERQRETDLIADTTLLRATLQPTWTDLAQGLRAMLAPHGQANSACAA